MLNVSLTNFLVAVLVAVPTLVLLLLPWSHPVQFSCQDPQVTGPYPVLESNSEAFNCSLFSVYVVRSSFLASRTTWSTHISDEGVNSILPVK